MKKMVGYILAIIGIVGVAMWAIPEFGDYFSLPAEIDDVTLLIVSIAVGVIGIFIIMRSGKGRGRNRKGVELPIFHGKQVVGYRRG